VTTNGLRLNLGCGATPTPGFLNYDNSLTVLIASYPPLLSLLSRALSEQQRAFAAAARAAGVRWADVVKQIPARSKSVEVIYSSHLLEHLDRPAARAFLLEARRVLEPGGILRLVVPDLKLLAAEYAASGDADRFVERTLLAQDQPRGWGRLKSSLVGPRHHAWMYDAKSLMKLLTTIGFAEPRELPPGETMIINPGALDLRERADESVYVEARSID
jgi:hypothetical protein